MYMNFREKKREKTRINQHLRENFKNKSNRVGFSLIFCKKMLTNADFGTIFYLIVNVKAYLTLKALRFGYFIENRVEKGDDNEKRHLCQKNSIRTVLSVGCLICYCSVSDGYLLRFH